MALRWVRCDLAMLREGPYLTARLDIFGHSMTEVLIFEGDGWERSVWRDGPPDYVLFDGEDPFTWPEVE